MTTSIIVYRNPLEQQLWEGAMNNSQMFPIMCAMAVMFISFLCVMPLLNMMNVSRKYSSQIALGISLVCAALTVYVMWI